VLRGNVAQEFDGKAGVVFDDPIYLLNRLSLRPQFDRAQLQSFHKDIAGARCDAADVDPVDIDCEKADQSFSVFARIDRRVHDGIV